jgi:hypothetical protein
VVLGNRETDAWASYYLHEWRTFLVAAVGMVREGFGMGPVRTLVGAYLVMRGTRLWSPYPDNDAEGALAAMRRFYRLVFTAHGLHLDPLHAAQLEIAWWRVHREHQHDPGVPAETLVQSLVELYGYVYDVPPEAMRPAARLRVAAMDLSDAWVAAGCRRDDPLLTAERRALVASHSAMLDAVQRH